MDPVFWLGVSVLLVAVSIAAVLLAAVPALRELGRAAQSAEKLFDTLNRELPPTLEAIRLTGLEITELTDDLTDGIQNTGQVAKEMHSSLTRVKHQAHQATVTTRSVFAGFRAAWQTLTTETTAAADRTAPAAPDYGTEQGVPPTDLDTSPPTPTSMAAFPVNHQRFPAELATDGQEAPPTNGLSSNSEKAESLDPVPE
jgi:hypothetical protein